jgi:hypothetical protein
MKRLLEITYFINQSINLVNTQNPDAENKIIMFWMLWRKEDHILLAFTFLCVNKTIEKLSA